MKNYPFLASMYKDEYYPNIVVGYGKAILIYLCTQIEMRKPKNLDELYVLTHAATERFNDLENEFYKHGSEIETFARECIAADFEAIAVAYGFDEADVEELIAPRDW